jgi:four helix bundle protein
MSSQSVAVNMAPAYRRKKYSNHFASKVIIDANKGRTETIEWLKFTKDCGYINKVKKQYQNLIKITKKPCAC